MLFYAVVVYPTNHLTHNAFWNALLLTLTVKQSELLGLYIRFFFSLIKQSVFFCCCFLFIYLFLCSILHELYRLLCFKITKDQQFLKYLDRPIWHQQPCHSYAKDT